MFYLTKTLEWLAPPFLLLQQLVFLVIWAYAELVDTQYATIWEERVIALDASRWTDRLYMPIALSVFTDKLHERYGGSNGTFSFGHAITAMRDNKAAYDDWSKTFNRMSPLAMARMLKDSGELHDLDAREWNQLLHPDNPIYDEVNYRTQVLMGNPLDITELFYYQDHLNNIANLNKEILK